MPPACRLVSQACGCRMIGAKPKEAPLPSPLPSPLVLQRAAEGQRRAEAPIHEDRNRCLHQSETSVYQLVMHPTE